MMADKNCKKCFKGKSVYKQCMCCLLVDRDGDQKLCKWCSLCGVWLCDDCRINPLKRMKAFGLQFFT